MPRLVDSPDVLHWDVSFHSVAKQIATVIAVLFNLDTDSGLIEVGGQPMRNGS
jgi:hypothetical protein